MSPCKNTVFLLLYLFSSHEIQLTFIFIKLIIKQNRSLDTIWYLFNYLPNHSYHILKILLNVVVTSRHVTPSVKH